MESETPAAELCDNLKAAFLDHNFNRWDLAMDWVLELLRHTYRRRSNDITDNYTRDREGEE